MRTPRNRRFTRFIAISIVVLLVCFLITTVVRQTPTDVSPDDQASGSTYEHERPILVESITELPEESAESSSSELRGLARFTPANVIGNLDCNATYGQGEAHGLVAVIFSSKNGTDIAIVDENGIIDIVNSEYFIAGSREIGRRPDGSILLAFRTTKWHQETQTWDYPALVFQGRNIIYETTNASSIMLAGDGSSFVVEEPTSISSSRLVIRDMNADVESHVALPPELSSADGFSGSHHLRYSPDYTEIFFTPKDEFLDGGTYWYMKVGEDELRSVTLESVYYAVLTSTKHGYFVSEPPMSSNEDDFDSWEISSRNIDRATGKTEDIWRTTVNIPEFAKKLNWSTNENWLVVNGGDSLVIDNRKAKEVFKFPAHSNPDAVVQRLSASLKEHGNGDDVGSLRSGGFFEDYLVYRREYGSIDEC